MNTLETFGDRLRHFREDHLQVSAYNFANTIGIDYRQYNRVELNEGKLNYDWLTMLAKDYNLSLNWLIAGVGDMYIPSEPNPVIGLVKEFLRNEIGNTLRPTAKQLRDAGRVIQALETTDALEQRAKRERNKAFMEELKAEKKLAKK